MKLLRIVLALLLLSGTAQFVLAQDRYGDAELMAGTLTVVRGGENLAYSTQGEQVPVFVGDVLRVGRESRVRLVSVEKSTVSMGANAVFQVKPFQQEEKQGLARMLFGRFRSLIEDLTGGEEVNTKTATAVIGVKGTENLVSVTPNGNTMLVGLDDITTLQGQTGDEQSVGPALVSLVLSDRSASIVIAVPQQVLADFQGGDNLDAPDANSDDAGDFPGQDDLGDIGDTGTGGDVTDFDDVGPSETALDDIKENLFRADVFLVFGR